MTRERDDAEEAIFDAGRALLVQGYTHPDGGDGESKTSAEAAAEQNTLVVRADDETVG
jgi:hypothetical protein